MKIAVWHNLPSGGGKRALYDQVKGLIARGHHVESWCPSSADQTYLPLSQIIPERILRLQRSSRSNWDKRLHVPAKIEPALASMEEHCRECSAEIGQRDFDILLAHSCTFFRATPIGRFVRLPKVLYQQEPFRWLYEAMPRLPWLAPPPSTHGFFSRERLREWALVRRTLQNARIQGREELRNASAFDRILVNSLFSRETIIRSYGLDAEVCYLGTDLLHFTDQNLTRERLIVGLGAFTREKNLELVIEALAMLPAPRPKLAWIGNYADGEHLAKMKSLATARGVCFEPKLEISDDDVISYLNRATAMVYAPRLEPFGLAVLEAGACALPVIAVAEGGIRETVIDGTTGLLVENIPDAVANAVSRLLADPLMARRMGCAGRLNVEHFWSQDLAAERIERALTRVLSQKGSPAALGRTEDRVGDPVPE